MHDLFEKKTLNDYSTALKNIFNLMTISRKYTVIGSASYKNAKYVSDYDLNELFESTDTLTILHKIYLFFKQKFVEAAKDNSIFITDFKCGMNSDGEPLRWNKHDMKKGFKILKDGRKIAFEDCILMKTTMKLDMITLIDGVYTEFSDNYLIKLGNDANFFPHDIQKDHTLNSIKHSFDEYFYAAKDYMKALKRCFAYYSNKGGNKSKMTTLFNFFNSPTGLLYVQRSEIEILKLLLEQKFRKPNMTDVRRNIKLVGEKCKHFNFPSLEESLARAYNSKSLRDMNKFLDDASNELLKIINAQCLEFLKKNKSVLLY